MPGSNVVVARGHTNATLAPRDDVPPNFKTHVRARNHGSIPCNQEQNLIDQLLVIYSPSKGFSIRVLVEQPWITTSLAKCGKCPDGLRQTNVTEINVVRSPHPIFYLLRGTVRWISFDNC